MRPRLLPADVIHRTLTSHSDHRGVLTEVLRRSWDGVPDPAQWNWVRSEGHVMRGVHVHPNHEDYLLMVEGEMRVGLKDVRASSPTRDLATIITLSADQPATLRIPVGVAHGFYCEKPCAFVYGLSGEWSLDNELGCAWDDPDLGLAWNVRDPKVSDRDAAAGAYADMVTAFEAATAP